MAQTLLLLHPDDLSQNTIVSGNLDLDNITAFIKIAQLNDVRRILGLDLYNKILTDFENDTLTGQYLYIYDNFIVDMLTYFTAGRYLELGHTKINNAGVVKSTGSSYTALSTAENSRLSDLYLSLGSNVELTFITFMKNNPVPEYNSNICNNDSTLGFPWVFLK